MGANFKILCCQNHSMFGIDTLYLHSVVCSFQECVKVDLGRDVGTTGFSLLEMWSVCTGSIVLHQEAKVNVSKP